LARLTCELHGAEPFVRLYKELLVDGSVGCDSAMCAGESDPVRGRDTEADAVGEQHLERHRRTWHGEEPVLRVNLEPVRERVAAARKGRVAKLQRREKPRQSVCRRHQTM